MATVVGSNIVNLPDQNFGALFQGAGDLLNAIGTQKQQSEDQRLLKQLQTTLSGDRLPADQAGPTRPGLTDPAQRLTEILNVLPQLNRPENQALAIKTAELQSKAIQKAQTPKRRAYTLTNSTGQQQKVSLTDQEATQMESQFAPGTSLAMGTPINQPDAAKAPASIREFESVVPGITPELRGTPEYEKAFTDFQNKLDPGRYQFVGSTPEGLLTKMNSKTGKFTSEDIGTELLPKTKKLVSVDVAGQLATSDALIDQIGVIREIATEHPEFTGLREGQWNKLKSKFVDNKDFTELDRNVEALITMAYSQSGKQISHQEMRTLKTAILPSVTQPDANFHAALDFAEKWLTANRDNEIKGLKSTGYFVGDVAEGGGGKIGDLTKEQIETLIAEKKASSGGR